MTLFVSGMTVGQIYTIQMAAVNVQGQGPWSNRVEIVFDPIFFEIELEPSLIFENDKVTKLTIIIIIVASLSFLLIIMSSIIFYKRKMSNDDNSKYLEAAEPFRTNDNHLWIETDEEKESNSSEKKLLNSDTEYTYVHNVSTNFSHSSNSPEPYATTDIFNHYLRNENYYLTPKENPYANPIIRKFPPQQQHCRSTYSCEDLLRKQSGNGKSRQSRTMQNRPNLAEILPPPPNCPPPPPSELSRNNLCQNRFNANYATSQESVISPKYLFQHPAYWDNYRVANANYRSSSSQIKHHRAVETSTDEDEEVLKTLLTARDEDESEDNNNELAEKLDKEFEEELQIFNDAITKFNSELDNKKDENDN